ncbi:hypothetical protein Ahy_A02g005513 [Arachis hypogaea]|uniref:Uncharacterized protein n=1 Tax=Arachis hypogaea TaxID=3818 RepID=A0A445E720_ARAHY|nr:hypothetical protein Ahy_A02g005513 [Arachis hypogaea]
MAQLRPKVNTIWELWNLGSWMLTMLGRYLLRVYTSAKHMTANVVAGNHHDGRVVASASTVEHAIKGAFVWGRACDVKAAEAVGEVLAMRLKAEEAAGVTVGMGGEVHVDLEREIEKKEKDSGAKVWAVVNAFRKRGIKVVIHNHRQNTVFERVKLLSKK